MFDTEDTQGCSLCRSIGAQVKDGPLALPEIGEIDIDGNHAAQHRLIRVGRDAGDASVEILRAVEWMRAKTARL